MNKNLTCNQVESLIYLYVEGKLSEKMHKCVDLHLINCAHCRKKIEDLKSIISKSDNTRDEKFSKDDIFSVEFINNLSAYVDNELAPNDNIKIKKMAISNPNAREKLEKMYKFKKLMLSAYEKTKNDYKNDFSKIIMSQVLEHNPYSTDCFQKLTILFCIIIMCILVGFLYLYL